MVDKRIGWLFLLVVWVVDLRWDVICIILNMVNWGIRCL